MSLYREMADYLDAGTAELKRKPVEAIPTQYAGTNFRSRLEAGWATTLDEYGITWEYEQELATLEDGRRYLPDFRLPGLATVIEAKGPHMQRLDKTREYAREVHPGTIVLIGYPPQHRRLTEWSRDLHMQWQDALGYSALFTTCLECAAYQWCRPRVSMDCRKCGRRLGGHFATCSEMRFREWQGA